jgi:hypothetical protein
MFSLATVAINGNVDILKIQKLISDGKKKAK